LDCNKNKVVGIGLFHGSTHDLVCFKKSKIKIPFNTLLIGDKAYQGHKNIEVPFKNYKNKPITANQKKYNKKLSAIRSTIERFFAWIKRFNFLKIGIRCMDEKLYYYINTIVFAFNYINASKIY